MTLSNPPMHPPLETANPNPPLPAHLGGGMETRRLGLPQDLLSMRKKKKSGKRDKRERLNTQEREQGMQIAEC
jgi:hypothetical protein